MNTSFFSVRNSVVAGIVFLVVACVGIGSDNAIALHPGNSGVYSERDCREALNTGEQCSPITRDCTDEEASSGYTICYTGNWHKTPKPTLSETDTSTRSENSDKKCDPATEICNPISSNDFEDLINGIIRWLTIFATPILVLMVVYAGFLYTTSAGSTTQTDRAKNVIKHAVIGFIIITLAYVIKAIVGDIF